jgi:hypothetical protein
VKDIVIIPTFERPEMLWLCMDYLAACPDSQHVQIRVYVDAHIGQPQPPRAEIKTVLEKFPQLSIQTYLRPPHAFHGNSYNILMAYKDAYETDARYVFLIEDDVMIHPDFFAWHWYQQTIKPLGCSIAVLKTERHGTYASLGVCFRREILRSILPHCRPAYFQDMRKYCRAHFAPAKFDCEQDGLFCRLLRFQSIVWATTAPLAQHVGWYGYHRRKSIRPQGTLEQRYAQVKKALSNREILREWVKDFHDIYPLQMQVD